MPSTIGTIELGASCAWLAVVVWLISRALSQRGLLKPLERVTVDSPATAATIAVIVPTRDEASNITACLRSLLAQDYPHDRLRILVVDDHSVDDTVSIARSLADDRLRVLLSPPLPPHWVGKSHACWVGACAAAPGTEWLCFIDADVQVKPALLASAVAAAAADKLDLLSLAPRQELGSMAERLILPCGLYLLAFRQDLRVVQSPQSQDVTATGQFMLIRRSAYTAVGGHAAVYRDICEDLELARRVKRTGGRVLLRDGTQFLSTRMYTGWRTLWPGIAKNLVDMLGGPVTTGTIGLAAMTLAWAAWLIPIFDATSCAQQTPRSCLALTAGLAGSAAAFGLHVAGTSFFRIPFWYGLVFPLGYTAGAAMALDSIRRRLSGRVTWKGRTYP